ncbi:MAG: phosphatidate cytidylyltransferase [Deltaproteobacteria bacterium]|nr:phosphatidate cytidylyltransferase [Deltaproteobacteria bacterium]
MLRARLWTAAVALPVVLAAIIFLSRAGFSVFIALLGGWGLYEVASMTATSGLISIVVVPGLGVVPLLAMLTAGDGGLWVLPALVTAAMFALVVVVGISGAENLSSGAPLEIAGILWVGVLFPYFALLRNLGSGIAAIIMMLLVVIASDTGAYFGGRAFGAHKLAPRVSPNKTIEGAIAGLIASAGTGLILHPWVIPHWSLAATAAFSGIIAVLAQVGDLAGSAFKRVAGVKDSGWIFPGHGGLLDRTCSLVFAAAFSYYCFK